MSYDPPTGEELKIAKKLEVMVRDLDKKHDTLELAIPYTSDMCIYSDFAVKGVRTNGNQRLTTAMDVYHDMLVYQAKLFEFQMKLLAYSVKINAMVDKATLMTNKLKICPKCKGNKGWKEETEGRDCEFCNGRGVING